jgi:hypothetical protein
MVSGEEKKGQVFTSIVERVDRFLFVKNGYSFAVHLVPFFIAALLLIILSVPADNLLLKLADKLQQPDWIWLPAGLLTLIATLVYLLTVRLQVRKAYLWRESETRRWFSTSALFILINTLMAYGVLQSTLARSVTWGDAWACYLIAVLSLTGLGWTLPSSWVKDIGVKIPDYTEARQHTDQLGQALATARAKRLGEKADVDAFMAAAKNLRSAIEKNLPNEPAWAKPRLERFAAALSVLEEQAKKHFTVDEGGNPIKFAAACKCQLETNYPDFVVNLKRLAEDWPSWQCP